MKKKCVILLVLLCSFSLAGGDRFMISTTANLAFSADEGFQDTYGSSSFYPEFKIGVRVFKGLFLWAGYGLISREGTTQPELQEKAESSQNFFNLGAGYWGDIGSKMGYKAGLGLSYVNFKEITLDDEISDSILGFILDGCVFYKISDTIIAGISLGYIIASDEVKVDTGETIKIKPGGFMLGIEIGVIL